MTMVVFQVDKMSCKNCAKHVTEAIQSVQPGADVDVDLASGKVSVSGTPAAPEKIVKAVEEAGYPARLAG
jgi:Cu+-exporting ATPase